MQFEKLTLALLGTITELLQKIDHIVVLGLLGGNAHERSDPAFNEVQNIILKYALNTY